MVLCIGIEPNLPLSQRGVQPLHLTQHDIKRNVKYNNTLKWAKPPVVAPKQPLLLPSRYASELRRVLGLYSFKN